MDERTSVGLVGTLSFYAVMLRERGRKAKRKKNKARKEQPRQSHKYSRSHAGTRPAAAIGDMRSLLIIICDREMQWREGVRQPTSSDPPQRVGPALNPVEAPFLSETRGEVRRHSGSQKWARGRISLMHGNFHTCALELIRQDATHPPGSHYRYSYVPKTHRGRPEVKSQVGKSLAIMIIPSWLSVPALGLLRKSFPTGHLTCVQHVLQMKIQYDNYGYYLLHV
jgi:hypothetical protein